MNIIIIDNSLPFPKILVSFADPIAKVTLLAYFPCCNNLLISSIGLTDDEMINSSHSNILENNSPKRLSLLQFANEGTGDKSSITISFVFRFTFKETRQLTSDKKIKRDCPINGNYSRGLDTSNQRRDCWRYKMIFHPGFYPRKPRTLSKGAVALCNFSCNLSRSGGRCDTSCKKHCAA